MRNVQYIEAPNADVILRGRIPIFLAGGITDCPDWQHEACEQFEKSEVGFAITLLNPRRHNFSNAPGDASRQIKWEYEQLRVARIILFWFPEETLCSITLYELGAWSVTGKPLVIGSHHGYKRRLDITIQTGLIRPELTIYHDLPSVVERACTLVERLISFD